jgi:aspartate-semialdehyde dehydrogenase
MVGRRLAAMLCDHPQFEPAMLVGSGASESESFQSVWETKEAALRRHYGAFWKPAIFPSQLRDRRVDGFDGLVRSDVEIVFSSVPERAGQLELALLQSGRTVFSNSPFARFDEGVPVIVPEVNANKLDGHRFVKNPNCVTSGVVLVLTPLIQRYGITEVAVTTYQSLSGRGDAMYALETVANNVYPLHGSEEKTEHYIRGEIKKVMAAPLPVSVACYRICAQEGHLVDIRVKTTRPVLSTADVAESLASFNPLAPLALRSSPARPIVVVPEIGRPRPGQDAWHAGGMAVAVGNISTEDDVFDLRLTLVVNNLVRGAAGGALLNAELWADRMAGAERAGARVSERAG